VGLFAVPGNGSNAHEKLKAAGMPVVSDFIESKKKGTLTRVRVGPFDSRAQADVAARQIRALKLDAVVVQP
jgi:cell division septation protein DedD